MCIIANQPPNLGHMDQKKPQSIELADILAALIADDVLALEEANTVRMQAKADDGRHALTIIAEAKVAHAADPRRVLTEEFLSQWLARQAGLEYKRIDPLQIDVPAITGVMSYAYAAKEKILAVSVTDRTVLIATANPFRRGWIQDLEPVLQKELIPVFTTPSDIERYQLEFYALSKSVRASGSQQKKSRGADLQNLEQLTELGRKGKLDANDQHVVNIVDWLLQYAFDQRASDIHMEPRRDFGRVRFRIDGVLHEVYQLPAQVMTAVTSRLKILARMDVAEKRRPQDGRVKTRSPNGQEIELRLSSMPTAFGEKLVLRIFDPEVLMKDFPALGLGKSEVAHWNSMITAAHGIILVTGPTGSGKTTTLYSTLRQLATEKVNVCTIEDPIELVEPKFNQMQVQSNIDLDFSTGVRTLLRQDPDIIMIGEIRDLNTAENAIQAALTGHLVISTLHTNDAPSAVTRLLDLGVPPYLIRSTLLGVVAQRLVRTLCSSCKKQTSLSAEAWAELTGRHVEKAHNACEAVGCLECRDTGFSGRIGIFEMMPMSDGLRANIRRDCDHSELRKQALSEGMTPLRLAGAQKVANGVTTATEVMRVVPQMSEGD